MASMPAIRSREIKVAQDIPISKTLPFWEGLKQGKVMATKCKKCGKIYFPPAADCGECLSSDMEWIELSGEATIETFTHVVIRPLTFQHERPYTVAIGTLKDGVRVLAWLTGFRPSEIKVGMKAKLTATTTPDGTPIYVFTKPT
ncbi:MAG: Zn-ribbon domain-containing OB-fold protein [Candidatus Nezhaarchaeota archaeon]|nr:Zn-ribbon domain-containing OB-fold protein [Candidatus Nezhaarchaeota archaeon]MCX8142265.1 Zn-ribbon domain-containing OB-fold protein [Candidatus Nezhaarchaeota archaeon]MDW8050762.1 Zn-ribbon domain-containing OB-fold protein [Nitrososphaerota archaeon]